MVDFFYSLDAKKRMIQNIVLEFCDMSLEDKRKTNERQGGLFTWRSVRFARASQLT